MAHAISSRRIINLQKDWKLAARKRFRLIFGLSKPFCADITKSLSLSENPNELPKMFNANVHRSKALVIATLPHTRTNMHRIVFSVHLMNILKIWLVGGRKLYFPIARSARKSEKEWRKSEKEFALDSENLCHFPCQINWYDIHTHHTLPCFVCHMVFRTHQSQNYRYGVEVGWFIFHWKFL